MSDVKITRKGFKCLRCGYEWIPRKEGHTPQLCPKCRSAYWNKPRVRHRRVKAQPSTSRSIKQLKKELHPYRQIVREELKETLQDENQKKSTSRKRGKK